MGFQVIKLLDSLNNVVIVGGIVPKGAYAGGTDYAVGDMVTYTDGNSYVMYVDATAGTAPTDATKWMVVAQKGATGDAGADSTVAGPQGDPGAAGADGLPVELQSNDPYLQWRVSGDPDWINLIALTEITGPQGETGPAGPAGYTHPNHSGEVTSIADGATTITSDAVTNTKLANMAVNTIKGRITAGTGDPEDLSAANVRSIINVADGANAYTHPNHSGDVTSSGDGATTIANDSVTYAKMQNVSTTSRVLGRITSGSGDVEELTGANIRTISSTAEASGFAKITVSSSAPGSPATGDLWVDTSG